MSREKRPSPAKPQEAIQTDPKRLEAFFAKLENPPPLLKEDAAAFARAKAHAIEKTPFGLMELMHLSTLVELVGAEMDEIPIRDLRKRKVEVRLYKGNREVLVALTPKRTFIVSYFENGAAVGTSEEQLGFRRIANWLLGS